jgi:hypothetical protein
MRLRQVTTRVLLPRPVIDGKHVLFAERAPDGGECPGTGGADAEPGSGPGVVNLDAVVSFEGQQHGSGTRQLAGVGCGQALELALTEVAEVVVAVLNVRLAFLQLA